MQDNIHGRKMSTTLLWIISASTWGSDQTIRSNVQLNAARTENAVAKTPCLNPTGLYDRSHIPPQQKKKNSMQPFHVHGHGTITKHNLQRMNAIPYPQKKDVDNIVLNASLHPLQNRNFTSVFDVQRPFRAKGLRPTPQNRNITSVFDVQSPFRAKRLRRTNWNRNFTSVFDVQRPFRAKRLQGAPQNRNITLVFDVQHPFRAKGLAD